MKSKGLVNAKVHAVAYMNESNVVLPSIRYNQYIILSPEDSNTEARELSIIKTKEMIPMSDLKLETA